MSWEGPMGVLHLEYQCLFFLKDISFSPILSNPQSCTPPNTLSRRLGYSTGCTKTAGRRPAKLESCLSAHSCLIALQLPSRQNSFKSFMFSHSLKGSCLHLQSHTVPHPYLVLLCTLSSSWALAPAATPALFLLSTCNILFWASQVHKESQGNKMIH